jgi:hypothetical protein
VIDIAITVASTSSQTATATMQASQSNSVTAWTSAVFGTATEDVSSAKTLSVTAQMGTANSLANFAVTSSTIERMRG